MLNVRYVHESVDYDAKLSKDELDTIIEHRPLIEFGGNTFQVDYVTYNIVSRIFFIFLTSE